MPTVECTIQLKCDREFRLIILCQLNNKNTKAYMETNSNTPLKYYYLLGINKNKQLTC